MRIMKKMKMKKLKKPVKPVEKTKTRARDFLLMVFLMGLTPLLKAQELIPSEMTDLMDDIRDVFTGPFVKTLLIICLAATGVVFGFNKDNEKMKRNCIAIGVAIAIIIGASQIVDTIWGAAGGD